MLNKNFVLAWLAVSLLMRTRYSRLSFENDLMEGAEIPKHNNQVCAEAPGKIILCGEHAVVAGRAAVALAVGRTTRVTIFSSDDAHSLNDRDVVAVKLSSVVFKNEHGSVHAQESDEDVVFRQEIVLPQPDLSSRWSELPLPPDAAPVFQQVCSSSGNGARTRSRSRSRSPRSRDPNVSGDSNTKSTGDCSFAGPIMALLSKFLALQGGKSKWPTGGSGIVNIC